MSTALRPILRTRTALLHHHHHPTTAAAAATIKTTIQTRSANLIPRPKRPRVLDQIVILSDGSSYKQLTTSPRGVIRSTKDSRNNPLWNPSLRELAGVEEDEAGRLKRFRDRYGMGFEEGSDEMMGGKGEGEGEGEGEGKE